MGRAEAIMTWFSVLLPFFILGLSTAAVRYDNHKVFRVTPRSLDELQRITSLSDVWENRVDFWKHARNVGSPVDVMVAPHLQSEFMNAVQNQGLEYRELIENVQDLLNTEEYLSRKRRDASANGEFIYTTFHPLDEINAWITDFVTENGAIASEEQLSTSYEGRPIRAIKLGKPSALDDKPIAYIQGGIHAREWVSPTTMMILVKQLAERYVTDTTVTAMLDNFDWYIVPVFNVDGYAYTWTNDRMWRKNRRRLEGDVCTGIDLNRNYDYQWGGRGSSPLSCSEVYHGPSPLSEAEHIGMSSFLLAKQQTHGVKLFMDFHSYGQYWLYPWGYTASKEVYLPDRDDLHSLATAAEDAITATHGKDYLVGESGPDLYPAAGGSEDWGYGSLRTKYTYVIELRDEGEYGFVLPEAQIQFTADEIFAAMLVVGERLVSEYGS